MPTSRVKAKINSYQIDERIKYCQGLGHILQRSVVTWKV
jgi:hypothetical protein